MEKLSILRNAVEHVLSSGADGAASIESERTTHHSLPAAFRALSPSTRTHHPSLPRPPSPATTASNAPSSLAYLSTSSSNAPGCNQTAGTPSFRASLRTSRVAAGGVMMETDVSFGFSRADRFGAVVKSWPRALMEAEPGLMGVTGSDRAAYQAKTAPCQRSHFHHEVSIPGSSLLWPYLAVLELAPTTAKRGEEKKIRAVASVDMMKTLMNYSMRGYHENVGKVWLRQ